MEATNRINMENTLPALDPKWKAHHVEPAKPDHFVEENFFTAEEYGAIYDVVVKTMQRGLDEAGDKWAFFLKISNLFVPFISQIPYLDQHITFLSTIDIITLFNLYLYYLLSNR